MSKTFIGGAIGREFKSEVKATEEVLDGVIVAVPYQENEQCEYQYSGSLTDKNQSISGTLLPVTLNNQSINQSNATCIAPPTNSGWRHLTIKTIKYVVINYKKNQGLKNVTQLNELRCSAATSTQAPSKRPNRTQQCIGPSG